MGQERPPQDYNNDQSDLERTQPSPTRPPRRLDWRPPDYQPGEVEPGHETPAVRRVSQPAPRRRRPPTEGAPAWVVGLGVGALLAVVLLLSVAFVLSRPPSQAEPTATIAVVTPTATLAPRPTFTPLSQVTDTPAPATEEAPAPTPLPSVIAVGGYVRVAAPAGLRFRETASPDGTPIEILDVGSVLEVIGGPQEAGGLTWWQLRKLDDGKQGWSAAGSGEDVFLEPAPAP
jgi:hypothetical protein